MLSESEAKEYAEQLHPAFAGYLFDGTVSDSDALAIVFHLIKNGVLEPEFRDNHIEKGIVAVRKMIKEPKFEFEREIVRLIFAEKERMTTEEVGKLIEQGQIQENIKRHSKAIASFPIVEHKLEMKLGKHGRVNISVNGEAVDTVEKASQYQQTLRKILLPVLGGIGCVLVLLGVLLNQQPLPSSDVAILRPGVEIQVSGDLSQMPMVLIYTGLGLVGLAFIFWASFTFSKKSVTYDFENQVIPIAQDQYKELYAFLQAYPPRPHVFTYEFIPHAIAFGIDGSWMNDFGLVSEVQLDVTPIKS